MSRLSAAPRRREKRLPGCAATGLDLPDPAPAKTSDEFEVALNIVLSEAVEEDIGLDVLEATVAKFAAALEKSLDVLRALR